MSETNNFRRLKIIFLLSLASAVVLSGCGLVMGSEERLNRAEKAIDEGDYRAAIIDARDVLRKQPDNMRGRLILARASVGADDGPTAEKEFNRALELGADRDEIIVGLGTAILQQNKFKQLIDEIKIEPSLSEAESTKVIALRAEAFLGLNQPQKARDLFMTVLNSDSENIDALLGIVSTHVAERNYVQARSMLDQVMTSHPEVTEVWLSSASLSNRLRDYESAEANYEIALQRANEHDHRLDQIRAIAGLSEVLFAQEKIDEVRSRVDQLVNLSPNGFAALVMDARLAYVDGEWTRAQHNLLEALRLSPNNPSVQFLLGAVQLRAGNLSQAEMYLSAAVTSMADNREARRLLAETRLQMQHFRAAQDVLRPIVTGDMPDARSLSMAARTSYALGQFDDSISYLEKSLEEVPGSSDIQIQLAIANLAAGKFADAERILTEMAVDGASEAEFRRDSQLVLTSLLKGDKTTALEGARAIIDRYPDKPEAWNLLGAVETALEDYFGARKSLRKGLDIDPENTASLRLLGNLNEVEEKYDAAIENYSNWVEIEPEAAEPMYSLVRVSMRSEDFVAARTWLQRIRQSQPDDIRARLLLAKLVIDSSEHSLAAEILGEVLSLNPENAEAHNLLGIAQIEQDEFRGAINSFRRASDLDKDNAQYKINLSEAQRRNGDLSLAMQTLDTGSAGAAADLSSNIMLASLKVDAGDLPGAMDIAKELQTMYPDSAIPLAVEAEIHMRSGNLLAASKAFEKAMTIDVFPAHAIRAFELRNRLGLDDVEMPLQMLLEKRPMDSQIRLLLATYFSATNQTHESVAEYEKVILSEPENSVALNNLAWSYYQLGDDRAESMARRAYAVAPESASVADTLGWILVEKGIVDSGMEILEEAVKLSNNRPQIKYHLAVAYRKAGKPKDARRLLEEILRNDGDFPGRSDAQSLFEELVAKG
jgi:putative PEP-CTERM system TPR-repeat lipoprotein